MTAETPPEEMLLRASGFATATIFWSELTTQQRGWTQLLPVLNDTAVQAWVFSGKPAGFTDELLSQISFLTLALTRPAPPLTAFVLTGGEVEPVVADTLAHIKMFQGNASFAAKLMAARLKPQAEVPRPFHVVAHVDPLLGQWLEIGPAAPDIWQGFMAGVLDAEVIAFGVGPRGQLPQKSVLHYPQCGIKGNWGDQAFTACAAHNEIDGNTACYLRVEGCPQAIFVTAPPKEEGATPAIGPQQLLYLALF
jgi:hypothetical protein